MMPSNHKHPINCLATPL